MSNKYLENTMKLVNKMVELYQERSPSEDFTALRVALTCIVHAARSDALAEASEFVRTCGLEKPVEVATGLEFLSILEGMLVQQTGAEGIKAIKAVKDPKTVTE